jgi:hypothetical protein
MTQYSESAFRKHWKGAEDWVNENKSIWLLERILAGMREPDAALIAEVKRLERLGSEKNAPVPAIAWSLSPHQPTSAT